MKIKLVLLMLSFCVTTISYAFTGALPSDKVGELTLFNDYQIMGFIRSNAKDFMVIGNGGKLYLLNEGSQQYFAGYHIAFSPANNNKVSDMMIMSGSSNSGKNCTITFHSIAPGKVKFKVSVGINADCGVDAEGNILFNVKD